MIHTYSKNILFPKPGSDTPPTHSNQQDFGHLLSAAMNGMSEQGVSLDELLNQAQGGAAASPLTAESLMVAQQGGSNSSRGVEWREEGLLQSEK